MKITVEEIKKRAAEVFSVGQKVKVVNADLTFTRQDLCAIF